MGSFRGKLRMKWYFFWFYKWLVLEMPSQVPRIASPQDELRDGHRVLGVGDLPPGPSKASSSQRPVLTLT